MIKTEEGMLYACGPRGGITVHKPVNGKKFSLQELQKFVGGYIEKMVPAEPYTNVYVNEEGALKNLPLNEHTWKFASKETYLLNGYTKHFLVHGDAFVVKKVARP